MYGSARYLKTGGREYEGGREIRIRRKVEIKKLA